MITILAVGIIHPPQGEVRYKELEYLEDGRIRYILEAGPARPYTAEQAWRPLDGIVLE